MNNPQTGRRESARPPAPDRVKSRARREGLPMHLSQFRLRTLLLAVMIVALLLAGGLTLHKRRQRFLTLASQHGVAQWLAWIPKAAKPANNHCLVTTKNSTL